MFYMGVDIGTTNTKAVLFDEKNNLIDIESFGYKIIKNKDDRFQEQDPETIFYGVLNVIKNLKEKYDLNEKNLKFISFSAMMHSLILIDDNDEVISNCIIWADRRSESITDEYKTNYKAHKFYAISGTPAHPMSPFYKILWFKRNKKNLFMKTKKFISIKDYIFFKLFGKYITDYSIASATGLFDIRTLKWSEEIINEIGIDESNLSEVVPTTHILKGINSDYKELENIKNVDFIVGASDGCLANLGSNSINKNVAAVTIGTSGAIRTSCDQAYTDEQGKTFCYYLDENLYIIGGAINNGGIAYEWIIQKLFSDDKDYKDLDNRLKSVKEGSDGLIFIPFIFGERAPYWDSSLKGSFLGIKNNHTKDHFLKACVEGICFSIKDVLNSISSLSNGIKKINLNGGIFQSEEWIKTFSDISGIELNLYETHESSALGAIILGKKAVGEIKDLNDFSFDISEIKKYYFNSEKHEFYKKRFELYKEGINLLYKFNKKI